jgi:hypothetical protein
LVGLEKRVMRHRLAAPLGLNSSKDIRLDSQNRNSKPFDALSNAELALTL